MMRRAAAVITVLLMAICGFLCYRYYTQTYLPNKNIDDAEQHEHEIAESVRPDILSLIDNSVSSEDSMNESDSASADSGKNTDLEIAYYYENIDENENVADPDTQLSEKSSGNLLENCAAVNGDTAAWIYIPGTNIDFPIMQSSDNDFYLHNGADGKYNFGVGCPFLDYRCDRDFGGFNSIVYAHHMTKRRMFADIAGYYRKEYFDKRSKGFLVLPDSVKKVDFFAYLSVPSTSPIYNAVFIAPQDKKVYIDSIFALASYTDKYTASDIKSMDDPHILLLSTCDFEAEDSRGVLVGLIL